MPLSLTALLKGEQIMEKENKSFSLYSTTKPTVWSHCLGFENTVFYFLFRYAEYFYIIVMVLGSVLQSSLSGCTILHVWMNGSSSLHYPCMHKSVRAPLIQDYWSRETTKTCRRSPWGDTVAGILIFFFSPALVTFFSFALFLFLVHFWNNMQHTAHTTQHTVCTVVSTY